ncbi:MAG: hypothetical protein IJC71_03175 [Clostridia bacterium]|nr:hypothetical protein [Clostridia bacterium]
MLRHFKQVLGFLLAAVILLAAVLVFLTPAGLEVLFPVFLRVRAEKYTPDSNTYAVYYDLRTEIAEADLVVVGVDPDVAESYEALGHFSRFMKQYNNYDGVLINCNRAAERIASGLLREVDEQRFYSRLEVLREKGLSHEVCDYLSELFVINTTMPPVRKFEIHSYTGTNYAEETTLAEKIADTYTSCERSAIAIVVVHELDDEGSFRLELEQILHGKTIIFLQMQYTDNCPSGEASAPVGFPFRGEKPAVYFVKNSDFTPFYTYYDFVTGLYGTSSYLTDRLDTRFTDYFFIISNGTASTYTELKDEMTMTGAEGNT